jgi:hypothetical protein
MIEVLPVLMSAASGWAVLGHTTSKEGAAQIVRERIAAAAGGAVRVWRRNMMTIETQGGPEGYCFQVDSEQVTD